MALNYKGRTAFTYPSGAQTLHANMAATEEHFYFASGGNALAFNQAGARSSTNDISLENVPTGDTIWGFTTLASGGFAVMTRNTGQVANVIGTVHVLNATGRAVRTFRLDALIQGVTVGERWRAPKAVVEYNDNLYVRVVRTFSSTPSPPNYMRWLEYQTDGNIVQTDRLLNQLSPTSLSDAVVIGNTLLIVQQNEHKVYEVNLSNFHVGDVTDLDSNNSAPWAASQFGRDMFIADRGGYIYTYELPEPPKGTGGGGVNFSLFSILATNGIMSRRLNGDRR